MRVSRFAVITLATIALSAVAVRPASAAPWQLCLSLDAPTTGSANYFLNFVIQGNGIVVSGMRGRHGPETHGPIVGALDKTPNPATGWELGLTVMIQNAGDYSGFNTENLVFEFEVDGSIFYKRWLNGNQSFTQGTAFAVACPAP